MREVTPEQRAAWRREGADRRKARLAALSSRERILLRAYYAVSVPTIPAGVLLTVAGRHTTRSIGVVVLLVALVLAAIRLSARVRRRQGATSAPSEKA